MRGGYSFIVGIANFTPEFMLFGRPSRDFAWPAIIIIVGLAIALRPRHYNFRRGNRQMGMGGQPVTSSINTESNVNIDVTFGGKKEIVTSKDFKGAL